MRKFIIIILIICLMVIPTACDNSENNNSSLDDEIQNNEENNDNKEFSIESVISNSEKIIDIQKLYSDNLSLAYAYYKNWIFEVGETVELYGYSSINSDTYRNIGIERRYMIKNLIVISGSSSYLPVMIEFDSVETAKEAYINSMYSKESFYLIYKNVIMLNSAASYVMLEGKLNYNEEFLINNNSKILYGRTDVSNSCLIIPNKTELVCSYSFINDTSLKEIICNDKLKSIGISAFAVCVNLSKVKLNDSLQIIDELAFYHCPLDYIIIPKSVKTIGKGAFNYGNIFCEAESKLEGWDENFYSDNAKVYYKGQWDYDNNGNPYVIDNNLNTSF